MLWSVLYTITGLRERSLPKKLSTQRRVEARDASDPAKLEGRGPEKVGSSLKRQPVAEEGESCCQAARKRTTRKGVPFGYAPLGLPPQ